LFKHILNGRETQAGEFVIMTQIIVMEKKSYVSNGNKTIDSHTVKSK
jgi:hypothetical protein